MIMIKKTSTNWLPSEEDEENLLLVKHKVAIGVLNSLGLGEAHQSLLHGLDSFLKFSDLG